MVDTIPVAHSVGKEMPLDSGDSFSWNRCSRTVLLNRMDGRERWEMGKKAGERCQREVGDGKERREREREREREE